MRRKAVAGLVATAALALAAPAAIANPDFGPGNSSKGPHDGKCHAPGHGTGPGSNDAVPGCKG